MTDEQKATLRALLKGEHAVCAQSGELRAQLEIEARLRLALIKEARELHRQASKLHEQADALDKLALQARRKARALIAKGRGK